MKIKEMDKKLEGIGGAYNIIQEICELIYMEMPLRYQDRWLEKMIERGIYVPQTEEEILREQEQ